MDVERVRPAPVDFGGVPAVSAAAVTAESPAATSPSAGEREGAGV